MIIERAEPEQAAALTEVAFAAKAHWGYPARWLELWHDELTITPAFVEQHRVFAAIMEEEIAGFYVLSQEEATCAIEHFWVRPARMGSGVGRALFKHALGQARTMGAARMEIESDPNAEGFYRRMGAHKIGESVSSLEGHPRVLPVMEFVF